MNRIFCTSCGNKMEFEKVKPNFCNSSFTIADAIKNPMAPTEKFDRTNKRGAGRKALNNLREMFKKVGSDEE